MHRRKIDLNYVSLPFPCSSHLAPKEKCVSRSFRLMLEDHFHWCLFADRWLNRDGRDMRALYGAAAFADLGASGCPFHMMSGTLHRMKGQVWINHLWTRGYLMDTG